MREVDSLEKAFHFERGGLSDRVIFDCVGCGIVGGIGFGHVDAHIARIFTIPKTIARFVLFQLRSCGILLSIDAAGSDDAYIAPLSIALFAELFNGCDLWDIFRYLYALGGKVIGCEHALPNSFAVLGDVLQYGGDRFVVAYLFSAADL